MRCKYSQIENREGMVDELLNSFRIGFGLAEHQSFIRCDHSPLIKTSIC